MSSYIVYGSHLSIFDARKLLEDLLSVKFEERDSEYKGGVYFCTPDRAGENFELQNNMDPYDGEPLEMKFPECPTLLYINATSRINSLKEILQPMHSKFALLRSEEF